MNIAGKIIEQLGGSKFRAMTGVEYFGCADSSITFKLPRKGLNGINTVKIMLILNDTYTMAFFKIRGTKIENVKTVSGVLADQLQTVFTDVTGLKTSL